MSNISQYNKITSLITLLAHIRHIFSIQNFTIGHETYIEANYSRNGSKSMKYSKHRRQESHTLVNEQTNTAYVSDICQIRVYRVSSRLLFLMFLFPGSLEAQNGIFRRDYQGRSNKRTEADGALRI